MFWRCDSTIHGKTTEAKGQIHGKDYWDRIQGM